MAKTEFTGTEDDLKQAAVILYNIRKREQEVQVTRYLSRNDDRLTAYRKKADEWIEKHIKPKDE